MRSVRRTSRACDGGHKRKEPQQKQQLKTYIVQSFMEKRMVGVTGIEPVTPSV